ncbi:MAG: HD-GYP domain-containing protein (c-di-GMP phosphodiesterase class II) [Paracoccaceae bacterium]|jgi:HD-GYP domain-containing protein (c-di-GMP phosphodiesterase class II)
MVSARQVASELREATTLSIMSLTGAAIAVAALVGVIFVFLFADAQHARDQRAWEERLGIVADTRSADIEKWVESQYRELGGLAENASLQLYMSELVRVAGQSGQGPAEPPAQAQYLQNFLTVVAAQAGYNVELQGPDVNANVDRVAVAGIALVDMSGRILVATRGMPGFEGEIAQRLVFVGANDRGFLDVRKAPSGDLIAGFSLPVHAIQSADGAARPIGRVVGIRRITDGMYPLLKQPGFAWKSGEIYLTRKNENMVEFLSPRIGGRAPLTGAQALDVQGRVSTIAARAEASFAIADDYAGEQVLFAARAVADTPWTVIVKIARAEAMGSSDSRRLTLIAAFLALIALVVVGLVAIWRHGTSLRASEAAGRYRDMAHRYEAQSRFLRLVADSQPHPMFIVDEQSRFRFANSAAASQAETGGDDLMGKSLKSVLGAAEALRYEEPNSNAVKTGEIVSRIHRSGSNGDLRVVQAEHIPVAEGPDFDSGVLVIEQDITGAVREREHREAALKQLVRTLLTVVDSRDPFAANHSMQVAVVARAVADEMGLDDELVDVAETAGSLMNVGKLLVSADLLTRAGDLGDDEVRHIRECLAAGAALLEDVPFNGPVVETLRQMTERWDGTGGPRGMSGDEILVTARIVAVANSFVAILNPRAWRPGVDFDQAIDAMLAASGSEFDRAVVAALINRLENHGGRSDWAQLSEIRPNH